jgi:transcriptional regulator with XRE-family HTH domain
VEIGGALSVGSFASRLRVERLSRKMTQAGFGAMGGVGRLSQFKYEHGDAGPNVEYLQRLVGHGIDVNFLLTGDRSRQPFTADERLLIERFRQSSPDIQAAILRALDCTLVEQCR